MTENKYWEDKNVLITGCSGLLGSWLTKSLVDQKAHVIGLLRDFVPNTELFQSGYQSKISIVRGELEDYNLIERILNEYEIDSVFHLGAQTIVNTANKNPISTFKANIEGTWNILEACRRNDNISRLVIASSDKAYGDQIDLPYKETTPLEGRHPYDVSKSCADLLSLAYYETYNLPVCITRCGNFYGGGDLNFNRLIPGTIFSIYNNRQPVIRSDGSYLRDYIYVKDGVGAYTLLAEKMEQKSIHGEAFNFSTETPLTVLQIVDIIIKEMKYSGTPLILNSSTNEIRDQYLCSEKAQKVLNWKPEYSIYTAIHETIQWYENFFKLGY